VHRHLKTAIGFALAFAGAVFLATHLPLAPSAPSASRIVIGATGKTAAPSEGGSGPAVAPVDSASEAQPRSPGATRREPSGSFAADVGFRTPDLLLEHYAKHGREFPGVSLDDYLRLAQALRDAPPGVNILEIVRDDGVTTRFERRSGAFIAFDRDGTIRTFFRPREGERYFRRQALRHQGGS